MLIRAIRPPDTAKISLLEKNPYFDPGLHPSEIIEFFREHNWNISESSPAYPSIKVGDKELVNFMLDTESTAIYCVVSGHKLYDIRNWEDHYLIVETYQRLGYAAVTGDYSGLEDDDLETMKLFDKAVGKGIPFDISMHCKINGPSFGKPDHASVKDGEWVGYLAGDIVRVICWPDENRKADIHWEEDLLTNMAVQKRIYYATGPEVPKGDWQITSVAKSNFSNAQTDFQLWNGDEPVMPLPTGLFRATEQASHHLAKISWSQSQPSH